MAREFPNPRPFPPQPAPGPRRRRSALGVAALGLGLGVGAGAFRQALPELLRRLAQRPGELRQLRPTEDEHDNEQNDDELRSAESSHGMSFRSRCRSHQDLVLPPDAFSLGYR